jgi:hypothetical protein
MLCELWNAHEAVHRLSVASTNVVSTDCQFAEIWASPITIAHKSSWLGCVCTQGRAFLLVVREPVLLCIIDSRHARAVLLLLYK